jgi:hypothetical protein
VGTSEATTTIVDEQAVPIRVLVADVENGPPDLEGLRGEFKSAWVVLRKNNRPRSLVEIDLRDGAAQHEIARLADALRSAPESGRPQRADVTLPSISVVIPTIVGRIEPLAACLDALAKSDYDRFEVILVDNRRQDADLDPLPALVEGRHNVRVVRQRKPGISAARNAGVAASTADVVAFTDDDVLVDPGWLSAIARRFAEHPEEQVVTGLILPSELETPAQLMFERYYGGFSAERIFRPLSYGLRRPGGSAWSRGSIVATDDSGAVVREFAIYDAGACGAGCNISFRRSALASEEPFDVALGTGTPAQGGEDLAAMIRVLWHGGRIGYEPAAVVHHQHRRGYDELLRQMWGYGAGFTAMLTSLVLHDPRHLAGLASQLPNAAARTLKAFASRLRGRRPRRADLAAQPAPAVQVFPPELARRELVGYLAGPACYLRSRRALRSQVG